MVCANLHVICGNCGSNKLMEYIHGEFDLECGDSTVIKCHNCATIHCLEGINEQSQDSYIRGRHFEKYKPKAKEQE